VTLKLDNMTPREALCAIQGASKEWVSIVYHHSTHSRDLVILFPSQEELNASPKITAEERAFLDAEENLDSVLVKPLNEGNSRVQKRAPDAGPCLTFL
jgi:hypothetical protein